jgi:predicted DNA repair protein MutK
MVFLEVAQFISVALIVVIALTQIIVPILMGTPVFPIFKRKNKIIDQALAEAKEERNLAEKEEQIKNLQAEIDAIKARSKT